MRLFHSLNGRWYTIDQQQQILRQYNGKRYRCTRCESYWTKASEAWACLVGEHQMCLLCEQVYPRDIRGCERCQASRMVPLMPGADVHAEEDVLDWLCEDERLVVDLEQVREQRQKPKGER